MFTAALRALRRLYFPKLANPFKKGSRWRVFLTFEALEVRELLAASLVHVPQQLTPVTGTTVAVQPGHFGGSTAGTDDLAALSSTGTLSILPNAGDGFWANYQTVPTGFGTSVGLAAGPLGVDQATDLVLQGRTRWGCTNRPRWATSRCRRR